MKPLLLISLTAFVLASCSKPQDIQTHPIISAYSQSYNAKDIETMAALMHPDIEWLSVNGNAIKIEVSGKGALVTEMDAWFAGGDLPKGSLRDWSLNGNYVAVSETASWKDNSGVEKSQSALTVYELENDLIRRVYYYPAE
jgi:hypothetical protein